MPKIFTTNTASEYWRVDCSLIHTDPSGQYYKMVGTWEEMKWMQEPVNLINPRFVIVTGDRDTYQLVEDPHVKVLYNRRGVSDYVLYDEAGIKERTGVTPQVRVRIVNDAASKRESFGLAWTGAPWRTFPA